jgi:hypothetical protein
LDGGCSDGGLDRQRRSDDMLEGSDGELDGATTNFSDRNDRGLRRPASIQLSAEWGRRAGFSPG